MKKLSIKKLPLISVLVALFLAVVLLIFIGAYSKKGALSQFALWGGKATVVESEVKDTDNDGLKDWEEELYGTDPLNNDTDGDGYFDGEEVGSGHNPLVKGPNDKQAFFPLPLGDKYNITEKIFTDIDSVLRSYLMQKNEYLENHPEIESPEEFLAQASTETLEEMFKRAILYNEKDWAEQAEQILKEMPELFSVEISDNDIYFSEDNSPENIDIYTKKLFNYLESESFLLLKENFLLLQNSLVENDFTNLDQLIKNNDNQIRKLRESKIPSSWKEIHKETLRISIILRNVFVSLRGHDSDPIKAMVGANEMKNVLKNWDALIEKINQLGESQGLNI